jgi:hypothetical protein
MAWKIDRDYLDSDSDRSSVGTCVGEINGVPFAFRLRDDDDIVYYHGQADADAAENDMADSGLYGGAYLWGAADSGTTDLQVRVGTALGYSLTSQAYVDEKELKPTDWVSIYG